MKIFSVYDVVLTPVFFVLIILWANYLKPKLTTNLTRPYYLPALALKMLSAIFFSLFYYFYYGGGDTTAFYMGSQRIWQTFTQSPLNGIELLFTSAGDLSSGATRYMYNFRFFFNGPEWNLCRITGFIGLFCFNTHLAIACFFAFFSFLGLWSFYTTMLKFFPSFSKLFAFAIFAAPSAVFWGSGIMKDTVTLGMLGFLFSASMQLFYFRKRTLGVVFLFCFSALVLYSIKSYLLIAYAVAFSFWGYAKFQESLKSTALKIVLFPLITLVSLAMGYFTITRVAQATEYGSLHAIQSKVYIYQMDHEQRAGGSSYTLNVDATSLPSLLGALPAAINVALFRPYLWEARNPVVLITAIESLAYFLCTLYILFTTSPMRTLRNILGDPELILCLIFTLILAFAVGISSYNFGVLARFKIPFLPFFGCALAILYKKPILNTV